MDDEFTFFADGTMVFNSQGQVWAEDYMAGAFACTDDAALLAAGRAPDDAPREPLTSGEVAAGWRAVGRGGGPRLGGAAGGRP